MSVVISLRDLKKDLQEDTVPLSNILRKARELADKLDQQEFVTWLDKELGGYEKDTKVPEYRIIRGEVKAWNPYRGWVPVLFESTESERNLAQRGASQSIPEFEELLKDGTSTYEMPYPADIANQVLSGETLKTKVSLMIPRTAIVGVLNQVRNKVYEWVLKLDESGLPEEPQTTFTDEQKEEAGSAQSIVHIQNVNTIQGNAGHEVNLSGQMMPEREGFISRFFWYGIVALLVLIAGNIISALILHSFFNI